MAEDHQNEIANEVVEAQEVASSSDPDPYMWVADEPRTTRSKYAGLAVRKVGSVLHVSDSFRGARLSITL
jgi:hypothetical protein